MLAPHAFGQFGSGNTERFLSPSNRQPSSLAASCSGLRRRFPDGSRTSSNRTVYLLLRTVVARGQPPTKSNSRSPRPQVSENRCRFASVAAATASG